MNFGDVTQRLARTMRINVPTGLPEQQAAAAVMMIAIKLIECQQAAIASKIASADTMAPYAHN